MLHRSVKLVILCVIYIAGILLASAGYFDAYIIPVREWYFAILLASAWIFCTTVFWLRGKIIALILLAPCILVLGIIHYQVRLYPVLTPRHVGYWIYQENPEYFMTGRVTSIPEKQGSMQSFTLGDISMDNYGESVLSGGLHVELPVSYHIQYADRMTLTGRLSPILNFGTFDRRAYLIRRGVFGLIKNVEIVEIEEPSRIDMVRILYDFRQGVVDRLSRLFPDPDHALAIGMLIGEDQYFTRDISDAFRVGGLTHIVALSGFNITIILVTIQRLFVGLGRRRVFYLSGAIVVFFVIMTGASASLTRAAIMGLLCALAPLLGRQNSVFTIITFAAAIMALINPLVVAHDVAFQLSFLATLGLVISSDFFATMMIRLPPLIREPIATTLAAQVLVLPILVETFGQVSLIAPITNLLVLPTVPLIMFGSFVAWLVSFTWWWLAVLISWLTSFLIHWVYGVAHFFQQFPALVWEGERSIGYWWGLYYAAVVFFFWWWDRRRVKQEAKVKM